MHTSVIQSPQAMTSNQNYRPRSPDLPGLAESQQQQQPPPRLTRLPSYQIQEPSLPRGYSFSPRGSYDASPFFSQGIPNQVPNSLFGVQQGQPSVEQSPPRLTPALLPDQSEVFSPTSHQDPQHRFQPTNSFSNQHFVFPPLQDQVQFHQTSVDEMARLRTRKQVNYNEDNNGTQYEEPLPTYPPAQAMHQMAPHPQQFVQQPPPQHFMQQSIVHAPVQAPLQQPPQPTALPMPHIDVRTKFPVARIKRIMQADEDVGKVAQATPTAVSKALELFMIALVTKGAREANNNNSKRVTATHLKHALMTDSQFDFLTEICESVPDEGAKGSKNRAKSEAKSEDSDEGMAGVSKKKAKGSRKKKGGDDEGSD